MGINPIYLIGGARSGSGLRGPPQQTRNSTNSKVRMPGSDRTGEFRGGSARQHRSAMEGYLLRKRQNLRGADARHVFRATPSACGYAQSAMGPLYCPNDRKVYLDTSFFDDLERRFRGCDIGSKSCQFAQAYVITRRRLAITCRTCSGSCRKCSSGSLL